MRNLSKPTERVAKWDNAKFFLIVCVLLGHSMTGGLINNGDAMLWAQLCINSFHMPLFIFIGGLFAKKTVFTTPFKYEKVIAYLLLNLFMKGLIYFVVLALKGTSSFELLSDNSVSWYIFATAFHIMIAHLLRNCKPWRTLLASIIVAILIGYVNEIGNILVMSRIIVFFPFFYLGCILNAEDVLKWVNKPWVRICSAVFLVTLFTFFFLTLDASYALRYLFTGNHPYYEFGGINHYIGGFLRLLAMSISALVSFAVLSLIPNKRIPVITWSGSRTLTVYALHRPVQYIIGLTFFYKMFQDTLPVFLLPVLCVYAVVLTLMLSLKPFEYVLWPCMHWDKMLAPVMNWFRKDEYKIKK
ncbi:MAG: acyltransferase family protein [Ruminococcus sp.]|nr:acyltransferase family protein [Ruminococcus sp.]